MKPHHWYAIEINRNKRPHELNWTNSKGWRNNIKSTCFNSIQWNILVEGNCRKCRYIENWMRNHHFIRWFERVERTDWKESRKKESERNKTATLRTNNETSMVLCGNRKTTAKKYISPRNFRCTITYKCFLLFILFICCHE